ncbi:MAG: hypothetical protein AUJ98_05085 [Bacteroidetes bacterium CG2_30_33_31]|nr:MAG: hypothetical protein AUJ98_05085 [Bacteroidetes bacterium CG2_30_33_31]
MKNLLKLFVMLFAVVAFAACGNSSEEATESVDSTATEVVEEPAVDTTTVVDTTAAATESSEMKCGEGKCGK